MPSSGSGAGASGCMEGRPHCTCMGALPRRVRCSSHAGGAGVVECCPPSPCGERPAGRFGGVLGLGRLLPQYEPSRTDAPPDRMQRLWRYGGMQIRGRARRGRARAPLPLERSVPVHQAPDRRPLSLLRWHAAVPKTRRAAAAAVASSSTASTAAAHGAAEAVSRLRPQGSRKI